jgi:enamine deaminase RidA (YjgF/YER057c/UK114 family)
MADSLSLAFLVLLESEASQPKRGSLVSVRGTAERSQIVMRTPVNPWAWSLQYGFNQAELIEGHSRVLVCSGQTSIDGDGVPQHAGDMVAQLALTADNLEAVLAAAGMGLADVVRMVTYTTDVDEYRRHRDVLVERFATVGVMPAWTLVGISRLAFPELLVEIEATAMR